MSKRPTWVSWWPENYLRATKEQDRVFRSKTNNNDSVDEGEANCGEFEFVEEESACVSINEPDGMGGEKQPTQSNIEDEMKTDNEVQEEGWGAPGYLDVSKADNQCRMNLLGCCLSQNSLILQRAETPQSFLL